jgi:hypothetical protein
MKPGNFPGIKGIASRRNAVYGCRKVFSYSPRGRKPIRIRPGKTVDKTVDRATCGIEPLISPLLRFLQKGARRPERPACYL